MDSEVYKSRDQWKANSLISRDEFLKMYKESIDDPEKFWSQQAERIDWIEKWKKVKSTSFKKPISIEWFKEGKLNLSANCVDRHAKKTPHKIAIIWEPDNPNDPTLNITYQELLEKVSRLANAYKNLGVKKGDRVTIYLPMIPEAAYAMLACARIGAIHSIVFAGFSADALADRIDDCESDFVITADEGLRGGRTTPLKKNVDDALKKSHPVKKVIVVKATGGQINWNDGRDHWYHEITAQASENCPPETMDAEDPLFILYTSGSTNKPKGVLHTTGGYLVYITTTFKYVFNYHEGDIYWCAADVGWVTGHSYLIYGPLANGATTLMFEGVPTYPDASRLWQTVDKHQVNILYTAPTLIRALMGQGDEFVEKTSRSSLKLLGSVGEPINPEAWKWYFQSGKENPIVDTWWQTETGGILITPLAGVMDLKPGSATHPFFGVQPLLVDEKGQTITGEGSGLLCIKDSWPGQMRGVYKNPDRFYETYFSQYEGLYFTGDGCKRDKDGDYWITGRVDDVLNVSGHRMGT
ncbi:MAG: acetate--CoA ligase, partial [Bdellovibrionales bacterium]|nr:acetate--CoA ligase [Bdellovibrionales bacterium]